MLESEVYDEKRNSEDNSRQDNQACRTLQLSPRRPCNLLCELNI